MSLLPFKEHDDLKGQHELLLEIFIDVWLQEGKKNNEQQKCVADAKNNQQGRKKERKPVRGCTVKFFIFCERKNR